jgi:putative membrane protein
MTPADPPPEPPPGWQPEPPPGWQPEPVPPPPGSTALGGMLHPAAIGVWSAGQAGVLAFLVVLNPSNLLFAIPLVIVSLVASVVRWHRFHWRLEGRTLVIEQGLLQRRRRVIPLERVQGVDVVRRLTHRLFGVVGLHVEAIGGSSTEGQFDALAPAEAEHLRRVLLAARGSGPAVATEDGQAGVDPGVGGGEVLVTIRPRTLVVSGLTEANAGLLAAVVGGAWQLFGDRVEALARLIPRLQGTPAIVAVTVLLLAVVIALFVAAQLLAYWDFRLVRDGGELRIRRGLLEQRLDTIPLRRIQAVRIEENLLRRLLGLAAVKADIAGRPGGGGETGTLLPLGRRADAFALAATVLGRESLPRTDLSPMPARARSRRLVRAGVGVLAGTAVAVGLAGWRGLAALALVVPAAAIAEASYRALGWAEHGDHVIARSGVWTRRTAIVPRNRLQSLALTATLPQRLRRLVTLDLQIARSPGVWGGPQLIDLDADDAGALLERLRAA